MPLGAPSMRILEVLGRGAVFEVALVSCPSGGPFVLKRPARGADAEVSASTRALERERAILAAANGRWLPALVETGQDEHGAYLLEALAPGAPLRAWSEAAAGPLEARAWSGLALRACEALAGLHALSDERGPLAIVHGDVSPDNAFAVCAREYEDEGAIPGGASFVDLSNAVFRDGGDPVFPRGRATLPYAAPEVVRGEIAPNQASDVYALCAVLLWMAVGPIVESSTEAGRLLEVGTRGVRSERIEARAELPRVAREVLGRALAFDPADRITSAEELVSALGVLARGSR